MSQQVVTTPLAQPAPARVQVSDAPQSSWAKARERLAWLLVAPSLLVVAIVAVYPLFQTFRLSLTNARLASSREVEYVGLRNYQRLFEDSQFISALWHTIVFTVTSVAAETILGMIIALVIHSNFKGRGLVRTAMLIPWAIPTVVSSRMWAWMYQDVFGVINDLLVVRLPQLVDWIPGIGGTLAGIFPENKIAFTANSSTVLPAIISVDVWKTTPFMALLLLAGLQIIPDDVYEAARIDGASKWQQFWQMTLPLLKPALLVALIFRTLDAFRVFDIVYVMRGSAPETMTIAVYARQKLIEVQRLGLGSAASVVIFLCIGLLVILYTRLVRVEEA
ncbi:MAG: sugar ABC transporter permease [Chloroflexota bacterium]|nr:sugar ABC transporter permease [Chloroflexota bacterium]